MRSARGLEKTETPRPATNPASMSVWSSGLLELDHTYNTPRRQLPHSAGIEAARGRDYGCSGVILVLRETPVFGRDGAGGGVEAEGIRAVGLEERGED